jgi:protein-S-isoprenylcysteine O-methyltransferase Ste14
VSGTAVVQTIVVLAVAAGLGYLVMDSADGWADWVVFGVVVCAAIGGAVAVWQRQYPAQSKKRVFTRDSESEW